MRVNVILVGFLHINRLYQSLLTIAARVYFVASVVVCFIHSPYNKGRVSEPLEVCRYAKESGSQRCLCLEQLGRPRRIFRQETPSRDAAKRM